MRYRWRHLSTLAWLSMAGACGAETTPSQPSTTGNASAKPAGVAGAPASGVSASTLSPPVPAPAASNLSSPAATPSVTPAASPVTSGAAAGIMPCGVATALVNNCQNCHGASPIGGAPMPLVTYADLMKPASTQPTKKVYELVQERIHDTRRPMPPTGTLSPADMSAIDAWVKGGAMSGSATDATCANTPAVSADKLGPGRGDKTLGRLTPGPGETCYEFKVHGSTTSVDDTPFDVPQGEVYEQFYYKIPWPKDSLAVSYATVPDNAAVLHHWILFSTTELQADGNHISSPLPTLIGTDPKLLTGWAVGGPNNVPPPDVGLELPAPEGRTLNVQWHFYNSTSKPQRDASTIQICTVPASARKYVGNVTWLGTEDLNGNKWFGGAGMPPKQESTFTSTCNPARAGLGPNEPIRIFAFEPHMHRLGKRMQTAVLRADGSMDTIFDQPFNFGNETHYWADHTLLPGDKLVTKCTFMNDTDKGVPFGESTDTEMCYQFVFSYPAHALANGAFSLEGVTDTCW